jgi:hypothetical protein
MKHWLLLGMVVIMMASLACHGATPKPSPTPESTATPVAGVAGATFETWLAAARAIESTREDYKGTIETVSKEPSRSTMIIIEGQIHVKGTNSLEELEITVGKTKQQIREYLFQDKVFVATMVQGQWKAKEATPPIYFNSDETQAEIESLYQKGAVILEDKVEPRLVSGEQCNELRLSVDLTKLSLVDRKFMLFSGGLPNISDVDTYANAINSFAMRLSVLPNGMMLESEAILELNPDALPPDGVVSSDVVSTITHYEINPVIPDSLFVLPP